LISYHKTFEIEFALVFSSYIGSTEDKNVAHLISGINIALYSSARIDMNTSESLKQGGWHMKQLMAKQPSG
jgi:hypothetical protein